MTPRAALARAWPYAAVAAVAAVPFAAGPFAGRPLYFRDLSLYFFPLRRFVLEGLRAGALRYWNPYVHEGEPLALPPISYPFDLLQMLRPDEAGISFVLALHVPLAAIFMMALARHGLGVARLPAAGAALVYALGGFALSTINLYVYVQALAWAPLAILGLIRAARGDRRAVVIGGLGVGVLLSTTGAEIAAQALAVGCLLALPTPRAGIGRLVTALALGVALFAPTAMVMGALAADSARAAGFPAEVSLAHSVHPMTLLQIVVAGFYGDTSRLVERWWGGNFFPRGFPYFVSLYLGSATLAVAAVGALQDRGPRRRLALAAAVALLIALGRWGIGGFLVETFEIARRFRYPSKAYFVVHLAVALLAALGLDALQRSAPAAWRRLALLAAAAGAVLAAAPLWTVVAPDQSRWFAGGFFTPDRSWNERLALLDWMLRDAAIGGAAALAVAACAVLAWRGRLAPSSAALGVTALLAADLLRSGAGLNPVTAPTFYTPSPEVARHHDAWRSAGRIFTCDPPGSKSYAQGRTARPEHQLWTFALLRDTLAPAFNVTARIPSALSMDLTMLVPPERVLDPDEAACIGLEKSMPALRRAGVAHVISLDALDHPDLVLRTADRPAAVAPLTVRAYAVRDPLPIHSVVDADGAEVVGARAQRRRDDPGHLVIEADTPVASTVVVREAYSAGWTAAVDGSPARLLRADGRHLAVAIPAGAHRIALDYEAPGLRAGALVGLLAAVVTIGLLAWPGRRRGDAREGLPPASP